MKMPEFIPLAVAVICAAASTAQADLLLGVQFSDGSTFRNDVVSGETLLIDLYIQDTDASTPLAAEGLGSGGGRLVQTAGAASLSKGAITGHPDFEFFDDDPLTSGLGLEIAAGAGLAPLLGPGVGVGQTFIILAQFEVVATGAVGEGATISSDIIGDLLPTNETFDTFADLDAIASFNDVSFTFASAAVPEPSSILLGSLSLGAAGLGAWRRRRDVAASQRG